MVVTLRIASSRMVGRGLSRLQMRDWSQIAPLLKKFLQKEKDSQILLLPLQCGVGFDTYFDSQH